MVVRQPVSVVVWGMKLPGGLCDRQVSVSSELQEGGVFGTHAHAFHISKYPERGVLLPEFLAYLRDGGGAFVCETCAFDQPPRMCTALYLEHVFVLLIRPIQNLGPSLT